MNLHKILFWYVLDVCPESLQRLAFDSIHLSAASAGKRLTEPCNTWSDVDRIVAGHVANGISPGFLYTGLFYVIYDALAFRADENRHAASVLAMTDLMEMYTGAKPEEGTEEFKTWEDEVTPVRYFLENRDQILETDQAAFKKWSSDPIVESLRGMPKGYAGHWRAVADFEMHGEELPRNMPPAFVSAVARYKMAFEPA